MAYYTAHSVVEKALSDLLYLKALTTQLTNLLNCEWSNQSSCEVGSFGYAAISTAPFLIAVVHVVGVRPEKKMIWVYTQSIIACVTNVKSWRKWPAPKLPRNSMGHRKATPTIAPVNQQDAPIPSFSRYASSSFPQPARWRFLNLP